MSKHVLCHIEKFTTKKNILLEIMKCIYIFANPWNASNRQPTIAYFLVFTRNKGF